MPTKRMRFATTLIAPIAIALLVAWFDRTVLAADQQRAIDNYEMDPLMLSMPAGYLLAVAGVLLIALVSRLEPNAVFGGLYAVGGVMLVFVMPLTVLTPERWSARGPGHLLSVVGAGLVLVGLATLASAARHRGRPA
jgi:hypothetical protein